VLVGGGQLKIYIYFGKSVKQCLGGFVVQLMVDGLATCLGEFSIYLLMSIDEFLFCLVCQSSDEDLVTVIIVCTEYILNASVGGDRVHSCLVCIQCVLCWKV
jgi:hypothetical protein